MESVIYCIYFVLEDTNNEKIYIYFKNVCRLGLPPIPPILCLLLYLLKYNMLRVPNYSMWRLTSQCKSYTVVINYKGTHLHFSSCFVQDRTLTSPFMQGLLRLINFFSLKVIESQCGF